MAKENTTTKLASRNRVILPKSVDNCLCGGDLIWSRVYNPKARMMKVCGKCGAMYTKQGY